MRHPVFVAAMLWCVAAAAGAQSTIQVLDYGSEPRSTLRYQFRPGQVDRANMEMAMSMSMDINGAKVPAVVIPPMKMTMELRVIDVAADGSAQVGFKVQSAEGSVEQVAGAANQALLNRALAGITQVSGTYRTDTRGRTLESKIAAPDSLVPANALQSMNDILGQGNEELQQFPEEVVGVGARWQSTQRHEVAGSTVTMVQEFTLKSRSGNRIELLVKSGAPVIAPVPAAGAAAAAVAAAASSTTAAGTIQIDLQKLVPTMSIDTATSTSIQGQDATQSMKMNAQMRMSVVPVAE
jgi:hypothetical protein